MKILLLTAGSRGDVEPFVALARSAEGRGHQVRLGIPDHSGVNTDGIDTVSLHMDFAQLIDDQGVSPRAAARTFRTVIRPAMGRLLFAAVQQIVTFAPDVVVYHPKILSAPVAANRVGIPSVIVETVPSVSRTREFPAPYITPVNLGPLNRATYLAAPLAALMFRSGLDAAFKELPPGPNRRGGQRVSMIPVSPQLLPRPHDWPPTVHLTGYWDGKPAPVGADAELEDFIDGGKFVYAGFGSMKAGDARERGEIVLEAARRCSLRVLVTTGWGGLDIPTTAHEDVLVRESVAHDHVLPHATAAIHHGGAGTVHAAARAGVPSIVVPFIGDQPFWGHLLHRRGLGPAPIPYRKLTADRLTDAIGKAGDCRHYAAQVGERVREEDGATAAVHVLENLAG
ncbi:glycosyltransferase [Arthrobacter sp. UC242_113]|uniref:glycosyltransferase n=1 Tax=Arthrobacter sp. UC242_113 TaxID=3374550 RepID=UPI0037580B69